jgi:hypothetical protein
LAVAAVVEAVHRSDPIRGPLQQPTPPLVGSLLAVLDLQLRWRIQVEQATARLSDPQQAVHDARIAPLRPPRKVCPYARGDAGRCGGYWTAARVSRSARAA